MAALLRGGRRALARTTRPGQAPERQRGRRRRHAAPRARLRQPAAAERGRRRGGRGARLRARQRVPRSRSPLREPRPARAAARPGRGARARDFGLSAPTSTSRSPTVGVGGLPERATLRQIIAHLSETYCGSIGVEFTHIEEPEMRAWLRERMESTRNRALARLAPRSLRILTKLTDAEIFEQFVAQELRRREALLARGRREHDRDARSAHRVRRRARRRGDRHRHGAPRAPQRAREHPEQERPRDLRRVRRHEPRAQPRRAAT